MKKISLLLLLAITLSVGCKNEGGKQPTRITHRDTSYPLGVYLGYMLKGLQQETVRKIVIKDTAMWVGKDSSTLKKEYTDSVYYNVNVLIAVKDSLTAASVGIKWNNKDTVVTRVLYASNKYVREFPGYDSAIAELKKYMDTTSKK